jgi:hypothetical protein
MTYLATVNITVEIETTKEMAEALVLWTAGTYANRPEAEVIVQMRDYGEVKIRRTARSGKATKCR